jgi:NADPH-dependent glutamate synthase beta subunit-like oxidoreductase
MDPRPAAGRHGRPEPAPVISGCCVAPSAQATAQPPPGNANSALGSDTHVELAGQIGITITEATGCIAVDSHQRTNVPGAYAAGDVVIGLDQISRAMGDGGVAATTIRNDLAARRPLKR